MRFIFERKNDPKKISNRLIAFFIVILTIATIFIPTYNTLAAAKNKIIVIDPGHTYSSSGTDSGATGLDGTKESELNMQLANKICTELQNRGYTVYSTLYISDSIPNLIKKGTTKVSLSERASSANSVNTDLFCIRAS